MHRKHIFQPGFTIFTQNTQNEKVNTARCPRPTHSSSKAPRPPEQHPSEARRRCHRRTGRMRHRKNVTILNGRPTAAPSNPMRSSDGRPVSRCWAAPGRPSNGRPARAEPRCARMHCSHISEAIAQWLRRKTRRGCSLGSNPTPAPFPTHTEATPVRVLRTRRLSDCRRAHCPRATV